MIQLKRTWNNSKAKVWSALARSCECVHLITTRPATIFLFVRREKTHVFPTYRARKMRRTNVLSFTSHWHICCPNNFYLILAWAAFLSFITSCMLHCWFILLGTFCYQFLFIFVRLCMCVRACARSFVFHFPKMWCTFFRNVFFSRLFQRIRLPPPSINNYSFIYMFVYFLSPICIFATTLLLLCFYFLSDRRLCTFSTSTYYYKNNNKK